MVRKKYFNNSNKEKEIKEDNVFIVDLLSKLPNDNPFYKLIKHELYFYADMAFKYKLSCCFLSILTVILPATVTAISALSDITPFHFKLLIAMLSAISSVSAGIIGVFNLREQWISYRSSCESLKIEISKYLSKAEPYNKKDEAINESMFIKNCERLFKKEGNAWIGNNKSNTHG